MVKFYSFIYLLYFFCKSVYREKNPVIFSFCWERIRLTICQRSLYSFKQYLNIINTVQNSLKHFSGSDGMRRRCWGCTPVTSQPGNNLGLKCPSDLRLIKSDHSCPHNDFFIKTIIVCFSFHSLPSGVAKSTRTQIVDTVTLTFIKWVCRDKSICERQSLCVCSYLKVSVWPQKYVGALE